ncbi:MAG: hypothetical protein IJH07_10905 [Ruminococcus sp.]|nr:hypothetical protein [Ruminococcus sp.]
MNKRLKLLLSCVLIFAIFVSSFVLPASSFETDVKTSTADMLLVNIDTDTVVFSQKPDNMWYAGFLSELVTFLVAYEMIDDPVQITYKVESSFPSSLPQSDGSLNPYIGKELTAKDLMAIMLLTSGSDAAYALADLASSGDRTAFVQEMNDKVSALGCKNTGFVSPGYNGTSDQYTTCRDLYTIYMEVLNNEYYREFMDAEPLSYIPPSLYNEDDKSANDAFTVYSEASILNENSPYYFRYANDAKYSHTDSTFAGLVVTTTYRGKSYFFAGLLGKNESEENVNSDAKKLTTWAYLNLSDRKVVNSDEALSQIKIKTDWGDYSVDLHPFNSAFKTMPNDYDEDMLSYEYDIPEFVQTPIVMGQSAGKMKLSYDGNEIDDINLIVNSDEGIDMLPDVGRFSTYVYKQLMRFEVNLDDEADDKNHVDDNESKTAAAEKTSEAEVSQTKATEG